MAANNPGVPGAFYDPTASNERGGLNTGIGWGTNAVYGPPVTAGMDAGEVFTIARIGLMLPAAYPAAEACGYAGKTGALVIATGTVAPGGTLPGGATNVSGRTVPAGGAAYGMNLAPPVDPATTDWQARVTTNGGTVSAATAAAVNTLVLAAKANGYWAKIRRLNLFCGDQLAAALVPLVKTIGAAVDSAGGSITYTEATGCKGVDASGTYIFPGFVPNVALTGGNTHVAFYIRSPYYGTGWTMGAYHGGTDNIALAIGSQGATQLNSYLYWGNSSNGVLQVTATPLGMLLGNRQSATDHKVWAHGTIAGSQTTTGGGLPAGNFYVCAYCANDSNNIAQSNSVLCAGYSVGLGFTDAEALAYSNDMEAFQTAMGRSVVPPVNLWWNPADMSASLWLSNFTTGVACSPAQPWGNVRGTLARTTGKLYFEVAFPNCSGISASLAAGLGSSDVSLTTDLVTGATSGSRAAFRANAEIGNEAGHQSFNNSFSFGDGTLYVLGVMADFATRTASFYRSNVFINTVTWAAGAASMFPMAGAASGASNSVMTLRTQSSEFSYAPPSGSVAWSSGT